MSDKPSKRSGKSETRPDNTFLGFIWGFGLVYFFSPDDVPGIVTLGMATTAGFLLALLYCARSIANRV